MLPCPRRGPFGLTLSDPDGDKWREDDSCSYCGSLNPDVFMARVEAGDVELVPTGKSYKVYLESVGEAFRQTYRDCPMDSAPHMPAVCPHWVTRRVEHAKFYFEHLSDEQRRRFVELLNERKLKIGYPGHFYVLPFFIAREPLLHRQETVPYDPAAALAPVADPEPSVGARDPLEIIESLPALVHGARQRFVDAVREEGGPEDPEPAA